MYPLNVDQTVISFPVQPWSVVGLIRNDQGLILAVSRKGNLTDLGLPGGKIDSADETPAHALCREVREETGLIIHPWQCDFVYERQDSADQGRVAWCFKVRTFWNIFTPPYAVEPNTWVGFVEPKRLLEANCLFREYNRGLFEHLSITAE